MPVSAPSRSKECQPTVAGAGRYRAQQLLVRTGVDATDVGRAVPHQVVAHVADPGQVAAELRTRRAHQRVDHVVVVAADPLQGRLRRPAGHGGRPVRTVQDQEPLLVLDQQLGLCDAALDAVLQQRRAGRVEQLRRALAEQIGPAARRRATRAIFVVDPETQRLGPIAERLVPREHVHEGNLSAPQAGVLKRPELFAPRPLHVRDASLADQRGDLVRTR